MFDTADRLALACLVSSDKPMTQAARGAVASPHFRESGACFPVMGKGFSSARQTRRFVHRPSTRCGDAQETGPGMDEVLHMGEGAFAWKVHTVQAWQGLFRSPLPQLLHRSFPMGPGRCAQLPQGLLIRILIHEYRRDYDTLLRRVEAGRRGICRSEKGVKAPSGTQCISKESVFRTIGTWPQCL